MTTTKYPWAKRSPAICVIKANGAPVVTQPVSIVPKHHETGPDVLVTVDMHFRPSFVATERCLVGFELWDLDQQVLLMASDRFHHLAKGWRFMPSQTQRTYLWLQPGQVVDPEGLTFAGAEPTTDAWPESEHYQLGPAAQPAPDRSLWMLTAGLVLIGTGAVMQFVALLLLVAR